MSITRVKPGLGIWVKCNGAGDTTCTEKRFTANIVPKYNRAHWAKAEGWGRGLTSRTRSHDYCPACLKIEQEIVAKKKAEREAKKAARLARLSPPPAPPTPTPATPPPAPAPKKPRKRKTSGAVTSGAVTAAEEANIGRPATPSPSAA